MDNEAGLTSTRRALLAATTGVVGGLAGCWGRGGGPETPTDTSEPPPDGDGGDTTTSEEEPPAYEQHFETVLDAVEDLGCDPSGEEPCTAAIEEGAENGVAIRFPPGTYQLDRTLTLRGFTTLGLVGEGDVSFRPPQGFNDKLVWFEGAWAFFSGIDVDLRAPETTAGLRFITGSGFEVTDVTFQGRGAHPDESVVNALALAVIDGASAGVVRNVVAREGSALGHYQGGNGRVGIWVGKRHYGHVRIEDVHLEEFGNNGIYASRCPGTVEVVGGLFRNNNISGVRLGGGGDTIRGSTFEVDTARYEGPTSRMDEDYNTRAVVIEQGPLDKSGQVHIEDCDVNILSVDRSQGGIVVWPSGNGPRIENCRITTEADWVAGVRAQPPGETVSTGDAPVEVVDTTIDGGAANGSAIEFRERPKSVLDGVSIEQTGAERDGVQIIAANPVTLANTSIATTRFPVFAIHPVVDGGACLLTLWGNTTFETDGLLPGALRTSEISNEEASVSYSVPAGIVPRCAGEDVLAELESPRGVVIADVAEQSMSWAQREPVEMALSR